MLSPSSLCLQITSLAFLLFLLPLRPVFAQGADTVYYNKDWKKLKTKMAPGAAFFTITTYTDTTQIVSSEIKKEFYIGGEKKSESHYTVDRSKGYKDRQQVGLDLSWYKNGQMKHKHDYTTGKKEGPDTHWFEDGRLEHTSHYIDGKKEGEAFNYYLDGKVRRQELFANDQLVTGKCFTKAGADTVYYPSEEDPVFRGGEKAMIQFIVQHMRYPKESLKKSIEGLVVVQFVVNKNGRISDMEVVKKVSPDLDAESLRVVQLMDKKFQPARIEGKPVDFRYTLPLRFGLQ
jgi:TonB family protein